MSLARHSLCAVLVMLAASLVQGCMATEPTTDEHGTIPVTALPDLSQPPDLTPAGPPTPPVVAGIPQTSAYTSYPLKGHATPGDTVLISGTAVGEVSAEVDPDGSFCALVQLTPNSLTTMTLVAVNAEGDMSTSTTWSVTQSGSPEQQEPPPNPSVNAALTGTASSSMDYSDGSENLMHDGDPTTFVDARWSGGWGPGDWFMLKLASPQVVKEIEVLATSACPLTAAFQLYISDTVPPGSPGPGTAGWTLASPAPMSTDSSDVTWIANYATPPTVQAIGIYFNHGYFPTGTDENCGSSAVLLGPLYAIAEIQAWTVAGTAPPPAGAPSCGGD